MPLAKDILLIGDLGAGASTSTRTPQRRTQGVRYRVGHGDTMWSIARAELGDGQRWRDVWMAQSSDYRAARDPSALVVGDVLAMPGRKNAMSMLGATGRVGGGLLFPMMNGPGDAGDDSGDVPDIPTVGPFGPQDPSQTSGGEATPSGQAHDSSGGGGGGLIVPATTPQPQPGPGPSPSPKPPAAMISSGALIAVVASVAVVAIGAGAYLIATRGT